MISRAEFSDLLRKKTVLLDGGYGTSFFEMGLGGVPSEKLNLDHPEAVEKLHRDYVLAGADILLTNTFGGNRAKLEESGLAANIEEIHAAAVLLARRAGETAGRRALVFGDISSTGRLPRPSGDGSFAECREIFREQASLLLSAGCDGLIVETLTDIKEMKAAVIAVRELSSDVPLIAQMAFDAAGTTLTGASVEVFAAVMGDLDVDVLGMNCLVGPAEMLPNLRRLAACTDLFLSVEPNAGDPYFDGEKTIYGTSAVDFSLYTEEFIESGASIIGGCCGTTPAYIRAIAALARDAAPAAKRGRAKPPFPRLASRTTVHEIDGFTVIGERINPTGRGQLKDSIRGGDWGLMLEEADAQSREGAHVLDVNFGVEKFFTPESVADAFIALDRATGTPLSLDIQTHELMETALTEYPGRPLVNSSACDEPSLAKKLPLLKKYGGMMILLAMEGDISDSADERMRAIDGALAYAEGMGLSRDRFLIDPLALSLGAGCDHRVSLEVVRRCAERNLFTTIGLSNLSHGMPNRSGINAAFLSQAIAAGLSSAIMNSGDEVVTQTLFGAQLLKTGKLEDRVGDMPLDPLVAALLSGRKKIVSEMVDGKIAEGMKPLDVSQSFLGGAMEAVGLLYETKKIFLPHILFAAETAFPEFDRLNGMMSGEVATRGKILLSTVEGDIHDIGKNIVGTVLRAGGFEVVDAGKNVSAGMIADAAERHRPDLVGLSAMMTTTVGRVPEVAACLRERGFDVPVLAGGASMNAELADIFGVHYSRDSSSALTLCKELTEKKAR